MFGLVNMSGEEFSLNSGEKPAGSFQIVRITSWSESYARWMFSSPLMTDKNTSSCYLNRLRNTRSIFLAGCLMSKSRSLSWSCLARRGRSRARSEKRIADTRSASIPIRWTNGKVRGHS